MAEQPTYDEQWGPVARRLRKAGRICRFALKTSFRVRPTILVEIKWRLGDEIMALPVYEALRRRYPGARIEVLCNYPDLIEDNPFVDAVNSASPSPDAYYLLRGAPRDVPRLDHYAARAGLPACAGRPRLHYTDWDLPVLQEVPGGPGPLVAVVTGASWETKRWPPECWAALCEGLAAAGVRVIELGRPGEAVGVGTDFTGRTSVREVAALLHHADAAVCCDSGLMHLGLAAGTPVVALFGPTDPAILIRNSEGFYPVTNGRDCRGCWNGGQTMTEPGVCPLGIERCLGSVGVEAVRAKVDAVLSKSG